MAERWNPKYPDFATRQAGAILNERNGDDWTVTGLDRQPKPLEWVQAPATSHVHSFAYESMNHQSPYFSRLAKIGGTNKIHVRFEPNSDSILDTWITHYVYSIQDNAEADWIWRSLNETEHPGEIVHSVLIAKKIPYERLH